MRDVDDVEARGRHEAAHCANDTVPNWAMTEALARKEYHCTMAFFCYDHHTYIKIGDLSC